jgi:hypothetical protein
LTNPSEERADKATRVVVAVLLVLGFVWLRQDIDFWLDAAGNFTFELIDHLNSIGAILFWAIPILALLLVVTLLRIANYIYLFCILVPWLSFKVPLVVRLNLGIARGIRHLFFYIFRVLGSILAWLFFFTAGEYARRRGAGSFVVYIVLPFVALASIGVGVWTWRHQVPRVHGPAEQPLVKTILVHKSFATGLKLDEIEITPSYTKVTCIWYQPWRRDPPPVISSKTSLVDQSGRVYYPIRTEGLELDKRTPVRPGKPLHVILYFPPLPAGTEYVSLKVFSYSWMLADVPRSVDNISLKSPLEKLWSHFHK